MARLIVVVWRAPRAVMRGVDRCQAEVITTSSIASAPFRLSNPIQPPLNFDTSQVHAIPATAHPPINRIDKQAISLSPSLSVLLGGRLRSLLQCPSSASVGEANPALGCPLMTTREPSGVQSAQESRRAPSTFGASAANAATAGPAMRSRAKE